MSEISEMNRSVAPRASDPMEHTIHDTEEFVQLVEEHNPENASTLLHHQPYQLTKQDPATRNEFNHVMGLLTSIDLMLTAGLNLVNASVESLQSKVRENNDKVHEILQRIMNKLDELRSCQCGEPERK